MRQRSKCCLIGVPDHQGVIHVGGRIGAASGPAALRRSLARLKGRDGVHGALEDLGDVRGLGPDIQTNHRLAADLVREAQRTTGLSIVVGGGHDHGYSQLLGVSEWLMAHASAGRDAGSGAGGNGGRRPRLGCINVDAHLDVRRPAPKIGSGSPFFLALERGVLDPSRFVEFGIQRHCNSPELWDYVGHKKVEIVPFEKLRYGKGPAAFRAALKKLSASCDAVVVSLDLDAAAAAHAPGVSAPQAEGFSASEVIEICEIAGAARKVVSLGIFELNPEHDPDGATARLGATAAYHFVAEAIGGAGRRAAARPG